jgi:hypothetical protein
MSISSIRIQLAVGLLKCSAGQPGRGLAGEDFLPVSNVGEVPWLI